MALQAQWGLEKTADSAISVSRGILQAATSDNVQPLAILACERFGNTLAMCPETCRKVEKTVLPTPPHAVLKFIHGTVGYSRNDCASYFGTSQAGLQFLSFATALINTMDTLESAKRLHHLLVDSASDKSLVPTLLQVEDLMESLEPRCRLSRFTDEVFGWQSLMQKLFRSHDVSYIDKNDPLCPATPTAEALKEIVDAFRDLYRIGDSSVVRVTFTTSRLTVWLIAFTKWCLGSPPSTYVKGKTPLLETAASKVRVDIDGGGFRITRDYSIENPRELVVLESDDSVFGMVSLRTYCQWLLREHSLDSGTALRAVQSAIAAAVAWSVDNISFIYPEDDLDLWSDRFESAPRRRFPELMLRPLRNASHVLNLMFEEFDSSDKPRDQRSIKKIPAVRAHLNSLRMDPGTTGVQFVPFETAQIEFFMALARIVVTVLALSLYQHPESLRVFTTTGRYNPRLAHLVYDSLRDGAKAAGSSRSLLGEAMELIGHYKGRITADEPVVMSSFSGQTVYFDFLETTTVVKSGYMSISWLPGMIWHGADKHHLVQSEPGSWNREAPPNWETVVHKRLSAPQTTSLKWVARHDGRRKGLRLSLTINVHDDSVNLHPIGVGGVLSSFSRSIVLGTCPHDKNSYLNGALAKRCFYDGPGYAAWRTQNGRKIRIVAAGGNDALGFYYCAELGGLPAVFRGEACLNCCVEVCLDAQMGHVIL